LFCSYDDKRFIWQNLEWTGDASITESLSQIIQSDCIEVLHPLAGSCYAGKLVLDDGDWVHSSGREASDERKSLQWLAHWYFSETDGDPHVIDELRQLYREKCLK